jgi:hypothetical protein
MEKSLIKIVTIFTVFIMFCSCSSIRKRSYFKPNPGKTFKSKELTSYVDNQNAVYTQIKLLAGLTIDPSNAREWSQFINAGIQYADEKCELYMDSLFWFNREKNAAINQISLLGAATAGVLAATEAAAKEVAITAIGFGLIGASVDNLSKSILYDLDPSGVRNLVEGLQTLYRNNISKNVNDRTVAFEIIRGYASICLPANIEAEVNNAVKEAKATATKGTSNSAPKVSVSPQVTDIQTPASKKQAQEADRIENILNRINSLDDTQSIKLVQKPPVTITADVQSAVDKSDPTNQRAVNGAAARDILKMLVRLTAKDEATISAWENDLK